MTFLILIDKDPSNNYHIFKLIKEHFKNIDIYIFSLENNTFNDKSDYIYLGGISSISNGDYINKVIDKYKITNLIVINYLTYFKYLNVKFICNSILLYNLPNTIIGKKQLSYFDNFDKIIINHPSQLDSSEFTNNCIPKIRLIPDYINKPIKLNNSLNIRNTLKIDSSIKIIYSELSLYNPLLTLTGICEIAQLIEKLNLPILFYVECDNRVNNNIINQYLSDFQISNVKINVKECIVNYNVIPDYDCVLFTDSFHTNTDLIHNSQLLNIPIVGLNVGVMKDYVINGLLSKTLTKLYDYTLGGFFYKSDPVELSQLIIQILNREYSVKITKNLAGNSFSSNFKSCTTYLNEFKKLIL